MKTFMDEDFLLQTETAKVLYHEHASALPIFDYHCHIPSKDIAEDRKFDNITQLWLNEDHYKWRALRANGIEEKYLTGNATDWEKFEKWAFTVPYTVRNPMYHWVHLELRNVFGVKKLLNPSTAREIWDICNAKLRSKGYSARGLMSKANVHTVCTTDDPVDSLEYHQQIKASGFKIKVYPAWRPDKAMTIEKAEAFNQYVDQLGNVSGMNIDNFTDYMDALEKRHLFFHENGCRLSDHGPATMYCEAYTLEEIKSIFSKARSGKSPSTEEGVKFKSAMLYEFAVQDHKRGWTQQYHIGPMRNNSRRMFELIGPDAGFDSMGDEQVAYPMARFFDRLDYENKLTRTIIYNLNPKDNYVMATMAGNFQDHSEPGKMQWGSAWWFADQKEGMIQHLNTLSSLGLLSRFVGMLTDSRSFLSYSRHEYFRRILCNLIGTDVENGEIPNDMELLGQMVEDICFYNAERYFKFGE
jgi:glucuronate isomerase